MEETCVRIDDLGRVRIPKDIRNSLAIEAGDAFTIVPTNGWICIRKIDEETMSMNKSVCVIFAKYKNQEKPLLFAVDPATEIKKGTEILVDVCKGGCRAVAVCDSMTISEEAVKNMAIATGVSLPLRKVLGIVKKVVGEKVIPLSKEAQL